jgi:murein DD-endopeptidase MepM/ murein hydrolase activator NlpD
MSVKTNRIFIVILLLFSTVTLHASAPVVKKNAPKKFMSLIEEDPDDDASDDYDLNYAEDNFTVGLETIVCTSSSSVNVRNDDLSEVLFMAKNEEPLTVFQGWGENTKIGSINGKEYTFIKVEMINKKEGDTRIGFIQSSFVQAKSKCPYAESNIKKLKPEDISFTGLEDKLCCQFPTMKKVTTSFTEGMRAFGVPRSKGKRFHAAADLYRYENEPIASVAPGVVLRNLYYFYQDTYALEVLHSGGFIVRYGEITGQKAPGIEMGKQLKLGETIGYMGVVNSGCCEAMLHFELYTGELLGPLTQDGVEVNGVRYNRRQDLIDPTPYLLRWENEKSE